MAIKINRCMLKHPFNSKKRRLCQRRAAVDKAVRKETKKRRLDDRKGK